MRRVVGRAELAREQAVSAPASGRAGEGANLFGSVARILASRSASVEAPLPTRSRRSPRAALGARARRLSGLVSPRRRELLHDPRLPLAQITPWLSGWSGLPSM